MSALIEKVVGLWMGSDGETAEVTYDGVDADAETQFPAVLQLSHPRRKADVAMVLSDGTRVKLPTMQIAYLLPDRSGVVIVVDGVQPKTVEDGLFPLPHNACVYNADGSLRFRLQNPEGLGTSFWSLMGIATSELLITVRDNQLNSDSARAYLVDGSTSELSAKPRVYVRL